MSANQAVHRMKPVSPNRGQDTLPSSDGPRSINREERI
ncbi:MAG: hypothetical protein QOI25_419 [Mycobacterium sp.]|nr:hypothetical protein [Mycobacterium sp.]